EAIARMNIQAHIEHISKQTHNQITLDEENVLLYVVKNGITKELGARRLKRVARNSLSLAVSNLLKEDFRTGETIFITTNKNGDQIIAEYF
ncbi:MAG: hypothetical protein EBR50_06955, partial [Proteobacteria bacterium]|nr:hypothetical protein [Pseudomonadota bacterium]